MLYGVQGIGKSTWANCEGSVFVPTEEGLNDIDCVSFPVCRSFDEVMGRLRELAESDHQFRVVVIDSLDWLEQLIWKATCEAKGVKNIEDFGYGKGYVSAVANWQKFLAALDYLREHRGMASTLIAHAEIKKFESPETESYDRYMPRLHKAAAAIVQEWCDEVLFACYKVYTREEDAGFNKKISKGIGGDERIIRTTEKPFAVAKNRLGMPDEIGLDWSVYQQYAKGEN